MNTLGLGVAALVMSACGDATDLTQSSPVKSPDTPASLVTAATGPDYFVQLIQAGTSTILYPGTTAQLNPRAIPGGWEVNVQLYLGNAGSAGQVTQYGNLVSYDHTRTVVICSATKAVSPPPPYQKVLIGGFRVFYPGTGLPPIGRLRTVYFLHAFDTQLNGTLQEDNDPQNNLADVYLSVPQGGNVSCYHA
jgi:hypothetical protein